MQTIAEKMDDFKFQYSQIINGKIYKNTVIDTMPSLSYRFAIEGNWKATDERVSSKIDKIDEWFQGYWKIISKENNCTNKSLYEQELESSLLNAYKDVKERWTKKIESEFENKFNEDLTRFLNSKPVD